MAFGREHTSENKAMKKNPMATESLSMTLEPDQKPSGKMDKGMGNAFTSPLMGMSMSPNIKMEN